MRPCSTSTGACSTRRFGGTAASSSTARATRSSSRSHRRTTRLLAAAEAQRALAAHEWPAGTRSACASGCTPASRASVGAALRRPRRAPGGAGDGGGARRPGARLRGDPRAARRRHPSLRDLGEHRLKDLSRPQRLFQLELDGLPSRVPAAEDARQPRRRTCPSSRTRSSAVSGSSRRLAELLTTRRRRLLTLTGPAGPGRLASRCSSPPTWSRSSPTASSSSRSRRCGTGSSSRPTIARTLGLREQAGRDGGRDAATYLADRSCCSCSTTSSRCSRPRRLSRASRLGAGAEGLLVDQPDAAPALRASATYAVARRCAAEESVRPRSPSARTRPRPSSLVTDENADAVAEICRRLDGLPLAIELAAPRVRTLTPAALLRRLDQRLALLTGGAQDLDERQRTLRGTIEWSYDLLLASREDAVRAARRLRRRLPARGGGGGLRPGRHARRTSSTASTRWSRRACCASARTRTASRASGCSRPSASSRSSGSSRRATGGRRPPAPRRLVRRARRAGSTPSRGPATRPLVRPARRRPREPPAALDWAGRGATASCCCASRRRSGASGRRAATSPKGRARSRRPSRSRAADRRARCSASARCAS